MVGHWSIATGQTGETTAPVAGPPPAPVAPRSFVAQAVAANAADDEKIVATLVVLLRDADPEVRKKAIELLATLGEKANKGAKPALVDALKDKNADVRTKAIEALQSLEKAEKAWADKANKLAKEGATGATIKSDRYYGGYEIVPAAGTEERLFFAPNTTGEGRLAIVRGNRAVLVSAADGKSCTPLLLRRVSCPRSSLPAAIWWLSAPRTTRVAPSGSCRQRSAS